MLIGESALSCSKIEEVQELQGKEIKLHSGAIESLQHGQVQLEKDAGSYAIKIDLNTVLGQKRDGDIQELKAKLEQLQVQADEKAREAKK